MITTLLVFVKCEFTVTGLTIIIFRSGGPLPENNRIFDTRFLRGKTNFRPGSKGSGPYSNILRTL